MRKTKDGMRIMYGWISKGRGGNMRLEKNDIRSRQSKKMNRRLNTA